MLFCGTKGPLTPNKRLQRTARCAARRPTGALSVRFGERRTAAQGRRPTLTNGRYVIIQSSFKG